MKTIKSTTIKTVKSLFIFVLAILIQSCETEIPDTDTDPPGFTFRITGDSFEQTFDQDSDFSSFQLNLREDASYDFILSGGDPDGLKRIEWYIAPDYIELETVVTSPWEVTSTSLLTDVISWNGNQNEPVTGGILAGTFRTRTENGQPTSLSFTFYLTDFGGQTGPSNSTSGELNILIANHDTEIINF